MPILFDPALKKEDFLYKEGREEGRVEGRVEGIEGGIEKARHQFVVNLLSLTDMSMNQIAELAGTSVEFVEKVKQCLG